MPDIFSARAPMRYSAHCRRAIAPEAPTEAESCLELTLRPDARGRLLVPMVTLPAPVLVRLGGMPIAGPLVPDAFRVAVETGLYGLTPLFSRGRPVPLFL